MEATGGKHCALGLLVMYNIKIQKVDNPDTSLVAN